MAGEGDAAVFDGGGVEEVEEDALALFDADGFAGAEGLVVDGVGHGVDLEAIGAGVEVGGFFGLGAGFGVVVVVLHVGGEEGLPVAEGEEVFLIVAAGVSGGVRCRRSRTGRCRTPLWRSSMAMAWEWYQRVPTGPGVNW